MDEKRELSKQFYNKFFRLRFSMQRRKLSTQQKPLWWQKWLQWWNWRIQLFNLHDHSVWLQNHRCFLNSPSMYKKQDPLCDSHCVTATELCDNICVTTTVRQSLFDHFNHFVKTTVWKIKNKTANSFSPIGCVISNKF